MKLSLNQKLTVLMLLALFFAAILEKHCEQPNEYKSATAPITTIKK